MTEPEFKKTSFEKVLAEIAEAVPTDAVQLVSQLNVLDKTLAEYKGRRSKDIQDLSGALNTSVLAKKISDKPGFETVSAEKLQEIMLSHIGRMAADIVAYKHYPVEDDALAQRAQTSRQLTGKVEEFSARSGIKERLNLLNDQIWGARDAQVLGIDERVSSDARHRISIAIIEKISRGEDINMQTLKTSIRGER